MDTKLFYYLSKNKLENIFPPSVLAHIYLKAYNKGEYLCHAGDELHSIYIFMEGRGKVTPVSPDGEEAIISYLLPSDLVGDIEYFSQCTALHSVMAATKFLVLVIPLTVYRQYLKDFPAFLTCMCESMSKKLYKSSMAQASHLLESTEYQLLSYITNVSMAQECTLIALNRIETAQHLGISVRHLRRLVCQLEEKGMIERVGKSICVLSEKPY